MLSRYSVAEGLSIAVAEHPWRSNALGDTHGYLDGAGAFADASGGCSGAVLPRAASRDPQIMRCMLLTLLQQAETKECSIVLYPAHSRHGGPIDSTNANSSILLMLTV